MRFTDKSVVVTGAGSGFGRQVSLMLAHFLMEPGSPVVGMSYEQMGAEMAGGWDPGISPIPLKRKRPPALTDNANVALFLASDDAEYVTGQCLVSCDGGSLSRVAIWFQQDHVGAAGLQE